MVALLVDVVRAERPVKAEGMLHAAGDVNRIRCSISGVDNVGCSTTCTTWNAAGILGASRILYRIDAGAGRRVHSLQCGCPSVLREIVEIESKAAAHNGAAVIPGRPRKAQPRRKLLVVVARRLGHQRNVERGERDIARV